MTRTVLVVDDKANVRKMLGRGGYAEFICLRVGERAGLEMYGTASKTC